MNIPVLVLLLFALWTLLTLVGSLGRYRIGNILRGKAKITDFSFPDLETSERHRRAIRAHLNCVENLPVFSAIVLAIVATGIQSKLLDGLAITFLVARILHTLTHVLFKQTNAVTGLRFAFFTVQLVCMFWMGMIVTVRFF